MTHNDYVSVPREMTNPQSCPYSAEKQAEELERMKINKEPIASQCPHPTQKENLSTERAVSSIPMSGKYEGQKWVYPSEQNWNPEEKDMMTVVPIHNAVNERCWMQILEWEKLADSSCPPKLAKFEGKPKELTVKARIWSLLGYTEPFDRHDWTIDRCGTQVKYIIDFYAGKQDERCPVPSFYLDVRPAPTPSGIFLRMKKSLNDLFS